MEFTLKYLLPVFLSLSLSACFGPNTFDASSKESVEQSAELMSKDLPESDKEDLKNAIIYYSMGGENGLEQLMTSQFSNNNEKIDSESFVYKNLEAINGLTAEEILNQYRAEQAKLKAKREAQEAERKAKREAESIRGNGDGQAIKIYADAFGKDAKFFKFYRSMLAYEKTFVDKDTTMILSPESEFFDFFSDKKGN